MTEPRVRLKDDGTLDDFFARSVDVHFEAMDHNRWWIGIHDASAGRHWSIRCGAVNAAAKGFAWTEEDG